MILLCSQYAKPSCALMFESTKWGFTDETVLEINFPYIISIITMCWLYLAGSPSKNIKVFCWQLGLLGPEKFDKYTWVFILHT